MTLFRGSGEVGSGEQIDYLRSKNNLSDVDNVPEARSNLGLESLSSISGLTPVDSTFIVGDGVNWVAESGATVRTSLGLNNVPNIDTTDASNVELTDSENHYPNDNVESALEELGQSKVKIVNSVSDLQSGSFESGLNRIWLSGYYGVGTAGAGPLYRDSADTTTADNGGTVLVDADGVRWKRPSVYRESNWSNHILASYDTSTSFRLSGDWTAIYQPNDWIELFGDWSGSTFAIIDAAPSLSAGDTIVPIEVESGTYDNTLSSVRRSAMNMRRLGYPGGGKFSVRLGGRLGNADGDNSIAIGDEAKSPTVKSIAIGNAADTTVDDGGAESIAIGDSSRASGDWGVALGADTDAWATCVAIGRQARAGDTANSKNLAISIGANSRASGQYSIAIGGGGNLNDTDATGDAAVAIGRRAIASFGNSVAIGTDAVTGEGGHIQLGGDYTTHGVSLSGAALAGASIPNGCINFAVTSGGDIQARWIGQAGTFNSVTIATGTS